MTWLFMHFQYFPQMTEHGAEWNKWICVRLRVEGSLIQEDPWSCEIQASAGVPSAQCNNFDRP